MAKESINVRNLPYGHYELEEATLYKEDVNYYFRLVYLFEDKNELARITFPKVEAGIPTSTLRFNMPFMEIMGLSFITVRDNEHAVYADKNGNAVYYDVLETKVQEMTLEEVEKELGHKVKIISKENDKKESGD